MRQALRRTKSQQMRGTKVLAKWLEEPMFMSCARFGLGKAEVKSGKHKREKNPMLN